MARRVTVTATPSGSNTTLAYWNGANGHELVDADIDATGHQVDVAVGETAIDIRLTSGGEAAHLHRSCGTGLGRTLRMDAD